MPISVKTITIGISLLDLIVLCMVLYEQIDKVTKA